MSDETTLLPCPFCGGEAQIVEGMYSSFQEGYAVRCRHCALTLGASGRLGECYEWSCSFATEAEAITAWNTRTHGTLTAEQVSMYLRAMAYDLQTPDPFKALDEKKAIIKRYAHGIAELNPDGLPVGLTISEDGELLNWHGENYVKQSMLESECDKWKAKAEEAGRAMNAAAGLWAKADAENRELQAKCDELNAELGSGTCEWVLEHSGTLYDKWRCSKCVYLFVEPRTDQGYTDLEPNFCPNCGRKVVS